MLGYVASSEALLHLQDGRGLSSQHVGSSGYARAFCHANKIAHVRYVWEITLTTRLCYVCACQRAPVCTLCFLRIYCTCNRTWHQLHIRPTTRPIRI